MTLREGDQTRHFLDLALADPSAAVHQCSVELAAKSKPHERARLLRARGLAHRVLGDLESSRTDLEEAASIARQIDDNVLWAGIALTLAGTRVHQGRPDQAKALLTDCIDVSHGEVRAEAIFQLGTTHAQAGELDEALATYEEALPLLRELDRLDWESNLLGNRGTIQFHRGDYAASIRDLDAAIVIQQELGIPAQAANNMANKAQALYMSGDIAGSLDLYRDAEEIQDQLHMPVLMNAQKCETYLAAGLFESCLDLARSSHQFHRQGQTVGQVRSLLPGAEAALSLQQYDLAIELAQAVHRVNGAENFPIWLARADLTRLEARSLSGNAHTDDAAEALRLSVDAAAGDAVTSVRAVLVAAEISLRRGHELEAHDILTGAADAARRSPLHIQVQRWGLLSETRRRLDNSRGAMSAVRAGLRSFDKLVAGVSSFDLRARAGRYAEGLTSVGVGELLAKHRLDDAVDLIEHYRSQSLQASALASDETQQLIAAETRLRRGEQANDVPLQRVQEEILNQSATEPAIEHRALLADGESVLTWVANQTDLLCIHQSLGETELHACPSMAEVIAMIDEQAFLARQLARRSRLSSAAINDMYDRKSACDRALATAILPPILGDRVILNPAPPLHGITWGTLPGLSSRCHVVAPARRIAKRRLSNRRKTAAIFGSPDLDHAVSEVESLAALYQTEPQFDLDAAGHSTISQADVLHLAGHFVADGADPLLSGIPLHEGTFRGVDYLEVETPPAIAVLSACASAGGATIGGTALGFASAALSAGTPTVVATQTLIEDGEDTVGTMIDLHAMLRDGVDPAEALNNLRASASSADLAAGSLIVLGAGW